MYLLGVNYNPGVKELLKEAVERALPIVLTCGRPSMKRTRRRSILVVFLLSNGSWGRADMFGFWTVFTPVSSMFHIWWASLRCPVSSRSTPGAPLDFQLRILWDSFSRTGSEGTTKLIRQWSGFIWASSRFWTVADCWTALPTSVVTSYGLFLRLRNVNEKIN